MWVLLAVFSAILLGTYDVAKKQALRKNGTFAVLLVYIGGSKANENAERKCLP